MACYHPVGAYQTSAGEVVFAELKGADYVRTLSLPCGQCIGCRLERSRQWAIRCIHEASLHEANSFVTLTYAEVPELASLSYRDFQLFMRRLRRARRGARIRFMVAGEYGEKFERPHYHACLFNCAFGDQKFLMKTPAGFNLYTSAELSTLWPYGMHSIGAVTFESAGYVAQYCLKKVTGQRAEAHYAGRAPEFARMSLRPGVGAEWFDKWSETDARDGRVVVNGRKVRQPRFYDRLLGRRDPDALERLQYERSVVGKSRYEDNTDARLAVRELVEYGRLNHKGGR